MCFSAGASFTAGVGLTFVGTETYKKVHKPSQMALASIPVFFAVQQFAEGIVWLTIGKAGYAVLQAVSSHIFLVLAQVVWPVLIPLSVLLLEEDGAGKRILFWLLAVGGAVAAYYTYGLVFNNDVNAQIIGAHIVYKDTPPDIQGAVGVLFYLIATIAPLFVSRIKKAYILGIIMSISFIVSALFYIRFLTSVWCFFAAVISFVVFYMISDAHNIFSDRINQIPTRKIPNPNKQ
jgi:hypothetical protein